MSTWPGRSSLSVTDGVREHRALRGLTASIVPADGSPSVIVASGHPRYVDRRQGRPSANGWITCAHLDNDPLAQPAEAVGRQIDVARPILGTAATDRFASVIGAGPATVALARLEATG